MYRCEILLAGMEMVCCWSHIDVHKSMFTYTSGLSDFNRGALCSRRNYAYTYVYIYMSTTEPICKYTYICIYGSH